MSEASAGLPHHLRAVPLLRRADLITQPVVFQHRPHLMLKDPVGLKYHTLEPEQYFLWSRLDGTLSLEQLQREIQRHFPSTAFSLPQVQQLVQELYQKGLVRSDRPGQEVTFLKRRLKLTWDKTKHQVQNFLFLQLPGWDPQRFLTVTYPWIRWCFSPWLLAAAGVLVVWSWLLVLVEFQTFQQQLPGFEQFFGWPNLIYVFLMMAGTKVLHELGHGFTCHHYGRECHEMGVMLLVFTPTLYCDVTDSWMLPDKWQRIAIAAAGIVVELVLSAVGLFVWWNTGEGLLHHLALNLFFICSFSAVVMNLNPLVRFDGYFMFSDWLEVPNLRSKADRMLQQKVARAFFGVEPPPDPLMPQSHKGWFALYAVGCWVYRWVLTLGIAGFLYTFFKPYGLQNLAVVLVTASVLSTVWTSGKGLRQIMQTPRENPIRWWRPVLLSGLLLGSIVTVLLIPFPHHIEAPFLLQPHQGQQIALQTEGRLELLVKEGQPVEAGQLLAKLTNWELDDQVRSLEYQEEVEQQKLEVARLLHDEAAEAVAAEQLQGVQEQLREYRQQIQHLVIRAPVPGVVWSPPEVPAPPPSRRKLEQWSGSPFDPQNKGAFLQRGTPLLILAPDPRWEAIVFIEQDRRNDLAGDNPVELRLESLPGRTITSRVGTISQEPLQTVPARLSNKSGGFFATVTDPEGQEQLEVPVFQLSVPLEEPGPHLQNQLRGRARILVERRSLLSRGWRYLRQTFYFRL